MVIKKGMNYCSMNFTIKFNMYTINCVYILKYCIHSNILSISCKLFFLILLQYFNSVRLNYNKQKKVICIFFQFLYR